MLSDVERERGVVTFSAGSHIAGHGTVGLELLEQVGQIAERVADERGRT